MKQEGIIEETGTPLGPFGNVLQFAMDAHGTFS